jgi:hypothetical protein
MGRTTIRLCFLLLFAILLMAVIFLPGSLAVHELAMQSPVGIPTEPPSTPSPTPTPAPTCPPQPAGCSQRGVYGYQPSRYEMRSTFNDAASNSLGNNAPTYDKINHGIPPEKESVSASRPIPHIILRGMAWQESHWLQFANSENDPDNTYACTLVSEDCGYGLMQITSCMSDGCGWFNPIRAVGELTYNLGTGTNFLIKKWNEVPFIGDNDHTIPEQWYYAVTAYNGWNRCNDPNRTDYVPDCPYPYPFYPDRPPYGEGNYSDFGYPYQERIWGWMAHPEIAQAGWHWLWRPARIAPIPRGIFGLRSSGDWRPPSYTPKPVFHLLPNIHVANGVGPTIVLRNTTSQTLAADVVLYNEDHSFNTRWLGAPEPPYPYPYIRLSPYESRALRVAKAFNSDEAFNGYARISASEGVEVTLQPPPYPHKVFLPLALRNYGGNCYNEIWNGGFEEFINGKPRYWLVSSSDDYPLADGTWFASGHYGAYLGGYDYANDVLQQSIYIPSSASLAVLTYQWYMQTKETSASRYDFMRVRLRDAWGNLVTTLEEVSNQSIRESWQTVTFDLLSYAGQLLILSFEAETDSSYPTSFFVDNISLWICTP